MKQLTWRRLVDREIVECLVTGKSRRWIKRHLKIGRMPGAARGPRDRPLSRGCARSGPGETLHGARGCPGEGAVGCWSPCSDSHAGMSNLTGCE